MTLDRMGGISIPVTVGAGRVGGRPKPADFARPIVESLIEARLLEYPLLGNVGSFKDRSGSRTMSDEP